MGSLSSGLKIILSLNKLLNVAQVLFIFTFLGPANISLHGLTLAVYDTEAESSVWNITFSANDSLNDKGLHVVQNISVSVFFLLFFAALYPAIYY